MKRRPWNDPAWVAPDPVRQPGVVRSVKLMPDYACELPLWGADWRDLRLSTSLMNDLADWQQAFDEGFDPMTGWRSEPVAQAWEEQANPLVSRLEAELGRTCHLEVDLWPVEPTDEPPE